MCNCAVNWCDKLRFLHLYILRLPFLPPYMLSIFCLLQISDYIKCNKCQGLSRNALHIVFTAIVLSVVTHALPVFSGQLSSRDKDRLDGLFRKAFKRGFEDCVRCFSYWWPRAWCGYQIISPGIRPKTLSVPTAAQTKTQKIAVLPQKSQTRLHIATYWIFTIKNSFVNRCLFAMIQLLFHDYMRGDQKVLGLT